jgi:ribosomal protein L37AE/L43A
MQSKQKVTLYIPPELHRKLKIKAAIDVESMSTLVEKAIAFYMQYPDKVEEIEASVQGQTHQVHFCPECSAPMVMRDGEVIPLNSQNSVKEEGISLKVASKTSDSGESSEEELVSCLQV